MRIADPASLYDTAVERLARRIPTHSKFKRNFNGDGWHSHEKSTYPVRYKERPVEVFVFATDGEPLDISVTCKRGSGSYHGKETLDDIDRAMILNHIYRLDL